MYGKSEGIPATFQIIYMIGWKPDPKQVVWKYSFECVNFQGKCYKNFLIWLVRGWMMLILPFQLSFLFLSSLSPLLISLPQLFFPTSSPSNVFSQCASSKWYMVYQGLMLKHLLFSSSLTFLHWSFLNPSFCNYTDNHNLTYDALKIFSTEIITSRERQWTDLPQGPTQTRRPNPGTGNGGKDQVYEGYGK